MRSSRTRAGVGGPLAALLGWIVEKLGGGKLTVVAISLALSMLAAWRQRLAARRSLALTSTTLTSIAEARRVLAGTITDPLTLPLARAVPVGGRGAPRAVHVSAAATLPGSVSSAPPMFNPAWAGGVVDRVRTWVPAQSSTSA